MAYFSLQDEEYRTKMEREASLEADKQKTQEQLAADMRRMLLGLGK